MVKGKFPMDVIFPEMRQQVMDSSLQKRVKARMDELGMNAYQTAKKAGLGDSFVRDILRGKTRSPSSENLAKLAKALELAPDWFIMNDNPGKASGVSGPVELVGLSVVGTIQAGTWLDRSIIDDETETEVIPVAQDDRFPRARQYGLRVAGDSMDKEYPDGSYVSCVDFFDAGIPIRDQLTVHVERRNGHLVEVTLKTIETIDGKMMLCPKSTNPKHLPLPLDGDAGTEIVIRGIVTGSYRRTLI